MNNFKKNFPNLGFGTGLRSSFYKDVLQKWPQEIEWFEIVSENYMFSSGGKPRRIISEVREHYPIVMHSVSMSVGSTDPIDFTYLKQLKDFADWLKPAWLSDHLCWTGVKKLNTHDLLPVPYTEESLKHIIKRIKQIQDFLQRKILFENPSTYLEFSQSELNESEFLAEMAQEADCGILLDLNNIYVSCFNHGLDPKKYIDTIPIERVGQIHLAGHLNKGTHIIDTHDNHICSEVFDLYSYFLSKRQDVSTMIEWDANIPEFQILLTELEKVKKVKANENAVDYLVDDLVSSKTKKSNITKQENLDQLYQEFQKNILSDHFSEDDLQGVIKQKSKLTKTELLSIYSKGYKLRLTDIIKGDYTKLKKYIGEERFLNLIDRYLVEVFSEHKSVNFYSENFAYYLQDNFRNLEIDSKEYELALVESIYSQLFDTGNNKKILSQNEISNLEPENLLNLKLEKAKHIKVLKCKNKLADFLNHKTDRIEEGSSILLFFLDVEKVRFMEISEFENELLDKIEAAQNIASAFNEISCNVALEDQQRFLLQVQTSFAKFCQNELLAISVE